MSPTISAGASHRGPEFWVVSSTLVTTLIALAAIAAWPIYAAPPFVLLVIVASAVGAAIALVATTRKWSALRITVVVIAVYAIVAVPLAVPDSLASLDTVPGGLLSALTGPVTSWKELVTIQIPVGSYRATAIPALIVFLLGSLLAFLGAWRLDRWAVVAAPVLLLMQFFGLAFGASTVAAPLLIGPLSIPAPREIALALLALAFLVVLLVWRAAWNRRQALYRARDSTGVRNVASHRPAALRRGLVAVGMLVTAGSVASLALAPLVAPSGREVLRTAVEPDLRVREAVSPLSTYRLGFSDELYDAELFTVNTEGPLIERVRLAALSSYDGAVFRVADPGSESVAPTDFRRVPTNLAGAPDGDVSTMTIEIGALSGLWVPLPDAPARIDFQGPRRASLVDGFYYSDSLATGIGLVDGGFAPGDRIEVQAVVSTPDALDTLPAIAPGQRTTDPAVPEELVEWVLEQDVGLDGSGLQELVDRLLARGYLSHSLTLPTGDDSWSARLADYTFAPSRSGHDIDRIATIFSALLDRQREVGVVADVDQKLLVSAVGDDEQFATAVALLARHFGYESRVVLGFRLNEASPVLAPAPCTDGVCRGGNLAAWAEVRSPGNSWITVDTTPQFSDALTPVISTSRDPELPTEVPSQVAENRLSPEAAPADSAGAEETPAEEQLNLEWLWSVLRIVGVVALVAGLLLAPFLTVIGAKVFRRSARRRAPDAEARITGGWLEWIDTAVDHGARLPSNVTRTESARTVLARRDPTDNAAQRPLELAHWADRAVFDAHPPTTDESDAFWSIIDDERRRWRAEQTFWQRIRSAISIASFARVVNARLTEPTKSNSSVTRRNFARAGTSRRSVKGVTRSRRTGRSRPR